MKLLVIAIDALPPDVLFKNIDEFPNIKKMVDSGTSSSYDAYAYGYGSNDNWLSLYTGLEPKEHGCIGNNFRNTGKLPNIQDYIHLNPFWKILNDKGIKVGMWKALSTTPPVKIQGYMISGEEDFELPDNKNEFANNDMMFCKEDECIKKYIVECINENIPTPKTPMDFGYSWDDVFEDNSLAEEILDSDYFQEGKIFLQKQLDCYEKNIINMQKNNPVDVIFYYTSILDYIQHFVAYDPDRKEVKRCIKIIDKFVGKLINKLKPENVIIISDHGIRSLAEHFPNTPMNIQKEAFGWRDNSIWLKNGQIVAKSRINAFMSGIHDYKGTFIINGNKIKSKKLYNMRTIDFYPTVLEMFDILIPEDRRGYVLDIFRDKEITNKNRVLYDENISRDKIAIIQTIEIPEFNRTVNEVFLDNRFAHITVFGEEKYRNIFKANERINDFIPINDVNIDVEILKVYKRIYISYRNLATKEFKYLQIK